ncbi:hypothetical protein BJ742DRAFT_103449 [Cladochytrium replicatum]|nr:hypothetical protein BJ742DRAFT_103449 [Cladochytrium replicatum]
MKVVLGWMFKPHSPASTLPKDTLRALCFQGDHLKSAKAPLYFLILERILRVFVATKCSVNCRGAPSCKPDIHLPELLPAAAACRRFREILRPALFETLNYTTNDLQRTHERILQANPARVRRIKMAKRDGNSRPNDDVAMKRILEYAADLGGLESVEYTRSMLNKEEATRLATFMLSLKEGKMLRELLITASWKYHNPLSGSMDPVYVDLGNAVVEAVANNPQLETASIDLVDGPYSLKLIDGILSSSVSNLLFVRLATHVSTKFIQELPNSNCAKHLSKLVMRRSDIPPSSHESLFTFVRNSSSLQTLYLMGGGRVQAVGDAGLKGIAEAISENPLASLREIVLSGQWAGDTGAVALCRAIESHPRIRSRLEILGLQVNRIGDAGFIALAGVVAASPNLLVLRVHDNKCGDDGAKALVQALSKHKKIDSLDFGRNLLGSTGWVWIGQLLRTNKSLTYLNLSACRGIESIGVGTLLNVLRTGIPPRMKVIHLGNISELLPGVDQEIAEVLPSGCFLKITTD